MRGPGRPQRDRRLRAVESAIHRAGLDALLVTSLPNVGYLTGLRSTAGAVTAGRGTRTLFVDFRYQIEARHLIDAGLAPSGLELRTVAHSYDEAIVESLSAANLERVGIESDHFSVARWNWFSSRLAGGPLKLVPTPGVVEALRLVKDETERDLLRTAGGLLGRVVTPALELVREGRSEREIAGGIDALIRSAGFEKPAFDTIVASGPNSALPHARPGNRRLTAGDLVLLDFGGVYDGYCVDLTRMATVGMASPRATELYAAVTAAQQAAIAAVSPGVRASSVDAAAREVLTARGLADAFGHGTGHGLGLEVHESPRVGRRREDDPEADIELAAGMVLTVEPGAYIPGFGGVRIEDDVLVTDTGCELLTDAARRLAVR